MKDALTEAAKNAAALADLIIDGKTTPQLSVKILTKLLEAENYDDFFRTMFEENLSYGACPKCEFETHWFIPEKDLNKMGYVTYKKDDRVKQFVTKEDCPSFEESCSKKKITP